MIERAVEAAGDARIVGIAGPPGAGKSTLAAELAPLLGAVVLPMDGFHYPQARLVELGRRDRMGAPDTFDRAAFAAVLRRVRAGEAVTAPGFDRSVEEPVTDAIDVPAGARIVVEGNYLLLWPEIAELLDVAIHLPGDDAREARLRERHIAFGKSPAEADAWIAAVDAPNARLIASAAGRADVGARCLVNLDP